MRANIKMTEKQDMAHFNGQVVTFTRVSTRKMNEMVMGRCNGLMEAVTMVNG